MKIAITLAVALIIMAAPAHAANNDGRDGGRDSMKPGGVARGDGINLDGSSDDAKKCREGTAGAALCREGMNSRPQ